MTSSKDTKNDWPTPAEEAKAKQEVDEGFDEPYDMIKKKDLIEPYVDVKEMIKRDGIPPPEECGNGDVAKNKWTFFAGDKKTEAEKLREAEKKYAADKRAKMEAGDKGKPVDGDGI